MGTSQAYGSAWSIGRFEVDRRSFPAQVLLVGPGPGDGGPGPGLVHGGYGSRHIDDHAGLHGVAQRRRPGACGQAAGVLRVVEGETGPLLGDLGDPIYAADGVRVWRRFYLGPDAAGVSPPGPRAAGLRRRIPPRPCGAGNPPGRPVFPQLCVRGRWGQPCSPE